MPAQIEEVVQAKKTEPAKKEWEGADNLLNFIFEKPQYVMEKTYEVIAIPIHESRGVKIEEVEKAVVEERIESVLGTKLLIEGYFEPAKGVPRWKYYATSSAPKVRDVVDIVSKYLTGLTQITTLTSYDEITKSKLLDTPFKVADQLLKIVERTETVKAVHIRNDADGVDIVSILESMSNKDKDYTVVISVRNEVGKRNYDWGGVPAIYIYCSCPINRQGLFCKHAMAVLASRPHIVLAALDYIVDGKRKPFEEYLKYWKEKTDELINELKKQPKEVLAGFIYYFNKFLYKRGLIHVINLPEEKDRQIREIVDYILSGGDIAKLEDIAVRRKEVVSKEVGFKTEYMGELLKIVWPEKIKEMRNHILDVIKELTERFGVLSEEQSEWPLLLTFAMVMSADYNKPPIVLHAVGDIGTFKTTGARLISEYITIPEYVFTYRGSDIVEKYREFLKLVSNEFNTPVAELENRVGGLITQVRTSRDTLTIAVSLPYIFSKLKNYTNGIEKIKRFISQARELGFTVQKRFSKPKVAIIDPAQLSNIEDYRMKYLPDKHLGLLTVMDVFDNHILVIDEGSRNPHGLETLLTKMSISSTTEGVRIIIITDNIEPFQEVISNPRYAPLHDRTYKSMTKAMKDELTVMENLYRPPKHRFDLVKLLAVQKFIESIPVPEGVMYLAKAIGNALEFKYTIVSVKPGVKHLRPIRREERAPIELDIFGGLDFKFISGGRYTYHTIMLSKFFAFLNGHDHVTLDDFRKALLFTVKSRIVVDANTYVDYKIKILDIMSRIDEALTNGEDVIKRTIGFIHLLRENADKDKVEKEFAKIVSEANINPILAPAIMSAIELSLSIYNIDISQLPDNLKYSIIELKLEKDDFTGLERFMDVVRDIIKSRQMVIKP